MLVTITHWTAAALGILGALLVALMRPRAGFAVWLPANVLWITWATVHHYWAMVVMFAVYLVITVVGLWRWRPVAE